MAFTNAALFSVQPQLSPAGVLTFAAAASRSGNKTCNVTLTDSEGASSSAEQLAIVVTAGEQCCAI
jgi:hypothetical protein